MDCSNDDIGRFCMAEVFDAYTARTVCFTRFPRIVTMFMRIFGQGLGSGTYAWVYREDL